jgi:hypothetical protein
MKALSQTNYSIGDKMSEQVIVYVDLPEEGSPTFLQTPAEVLGNGHYKLLTPQKYNPDDVVMQFLPGAIVRCEVKNNGGEEILVAVAQVG